jgi:cytochrome c peroxidase
MAGSLRTDCRSGSRVAGAGARSAAAVRTQVARINKELELIRKLLAPAAAMWLGALGWVLVAPGTPTVLSAAADDRGARAQGGGDRDNDNDDGGLDRALAAVLSHAGFTGRIESTLEARLGRRINASLADLGRMLWFDSAHSLGQDNTCAGCHSPTNGFGDTQSIAIGVQNNGIVGPRRAGPRNQRRSPMAINAAFFPALMWNGRFNAVSGDPFNGTLGFVFPQPEGTLRFSGAANAATGVRHLLQAQAHIPPTELVEVGGFTGTAGTIGSRFDQFDDGHGLPVPAPDGTGFRNEPIRQAALQVLNGIPKYRRLFHQQFPQVSLAPDAKPGHDIDFYMFGKAIAEFEFSLTFANAPVDQFARGRHDALRPSEKRGALLFFGKAGCVSCHGVSGRSNEMFSDFKEHVAGVPQIAPFFGVGESNMIYDGPGEDEDFGLEQITGNPADRYKFRTPPLRNIALSPAFFHNGAFTRLDDAIRHHLDVFESARAYDPRAAGVDRDLRMRLGPIEPVLDRLDPLLRTPIALKRAELNDLVRFVSDGLLDERARRENLCRLVPESVPSGQPVFQFQGCR